MEHTETNEAREFEHALVSIFAIHQTKDPDDVVKKCMESVLKTYTSRLKELILGKMSKEGEEIPEIVEMPHMGTITGELEDIANHHEKIGFNKGLDTCKSIVEEVMR